MVPEDNTQGKHMDAILCTMALLCIEVGFDEVSSLFPTFLVCHLDYFFFLKFSFYILTDNLK